MTPTATGRHCASCQKNVVDFTHMADAEILAFLAKGGGQLCGRFAASQVGRPLQPLPLAPPSRWRAWLAAAVAVWGLREVAGATAQAQAPVEQRALPANSPLNYSKKPDYEGTEAGVVLRGVVVDSVTQEGLPGVTVLIKGTTTGTATNMHGEFSLQLPPRLPSQPMPVIEFRSIGYASQERSGTDFATQPARVMLHTDIRGLGELVVTGGLGLHYRPWPWRPRAFYHWGKYWITRPFRW